MKYLLEQFADIKILRYLVPGFKNLSLKQKKLVYYLSQAAYYGRDIIFDQNYKHNLTIRRTLEAIIRHYTGDRTNADFEKLVIYTKRIWFSNGIHHHYSTEKIMPEFDENYFRHLLNHTPLEKLPLNKGESQTDLTSKILMPIFDPEMDKKRVNLAAGQDIITTSANNFYESITQSEVEEYYGKLNEKKDPQPVSHGLNSKIMKENGNIIEKVYKIGGMYSEAIQQIVFWLKKAEEIAENELQASCFEKLISFYTSGNLKTFDEYNILWVKDTESLIDTINGFIEVYGDPLGYKATFESVVSIKDIETTEKFQTISNSAGWFELNLPIDNAFKREKPEGVSYKVIQAVAESGDCSPSTPIGINLPNADWIRSQYGSKSVSLVNIEDAYNEVSKDDGTLEEFYLPDQHELIRTYGSLTDKLHTGLHEVIGHGSGKILQGIGSPKETLKNYASTLEEARADLVALYFLYDPYLVSLGLIPSLDAGKAEYIRYIHNGLFKQLVRIEEGAQLEESHMRNRQLIALWSFEKGAEENIIEQISENGKTYFVIHDYEKLRNLFGKLLAEVQRIKSEGDFEAGKKLVENYGVKVDSKLHKEALERYRKLGIAPFSGFVNPKIVPIYKDEEIIDVQIEYPDSFMEQMFDYADNYSVLPN